MLASELWGFCEPCESWRCSDQWYLAPRDEPNCPVCGAAPGLIETRDGDRRRVSVLLRLPPGAVEPAI